MNCLALILGKLEIKKLQSLSFRALQTLSRFCTLLRVINITLLLLNLLLRGTFLYTVNICLFNFHSKIEVNENHIHSHYYSYNYNLYMPHSISCNKYIYIINYIKHEVYISSLTSEFIEGLNLWFLHEPILTNENHSLHF